MAFEFILSTDEIREKMFDFIKPVYKGTVDFDVDFIDWVYGVYDNETKLFITFIKWEKNDNSRYIVITENRGIYYVIAKRYKYTLSEIPAKLVPYKNVVRSAIKLYENEIQRRKYDSGLLNEQEEHLNGIIEKMKDRGRPSVEISCYEDAEKLFVRDNFNYNYISRRYNKNTVSEFDKYMSDKKMRAVRGEKYWALLTGISAYPNKLNEEDYKHISEDFGNAGGIFGEGTDCLYADKTLEVIKKAYHSGVISCGYTGFIERYIGTCILSFPDSIQELRPLLDFITENMKSEGFKRLDFSRKELEKYIYKNGSGFRFVCTTNEQRESIFDFLKPQYTYNNDLNVMNINWTTGVYDNESGIFLTLIYYVSDGIARCGVEFRSYIVITDSGSVFKVDNNYEFEKGTYHFGIPGQYETLSDKVKEGIDSYENDYIYRRNLNKNTEKQFKAIAAEMDDRCRKSFPISREEDALKLFETANFNAYVIFSEYNKKTIRDFNKFADYDKMLLWRGNKYLLLLNKAKSRFITDDECCQLFSDACNVFCRGVNDTYDKEFLCTVKSMYHRHIGSENMRRMENTLKIYLDTYAEEYPEKLGNILPLVKFVKAHSSDKYLMKTISSISKSLWKRLFK